MPLRRFRKDNSQNVAINTSVCLACSKDLKDSKTKAICLQYMNLYNKQEGLIAQQEEIKTYALTSAFVYGALMIITYFITFFVDPKKFFNLTFGIILIIALLSSTGLFILHFNNKGKIKAIKWQISKLKHQ